MPKSKSVIEKNILEEKLKVPYKSLSQKQLKSKDIPTEIHTTISNEKINKDVIKENAIIRANEIAKKMKTFVSEIRELDNATYLAKFQNNQHRFVSGASDEFLDIIRPHSKIQKSIIDYRAVVKFFFKNVSIY